MPILSIVKRLFSHNGTHQNGKSPEPETLPLPVTQEQPLERTERRRRPRRRGKGRPTFESPATTLLHQTPVLEPGHFGDIPVSGPVAQSLREMGYEAPSPVQAQVIPLMVTGKDVVGQAQTGTGKTAAFGIPLVETLDPTIDEVQAVVLVPTRELALQVSGELSRLSRHRGLRVVTIYGGQPIVKQFAQLNPPPQIIVGTPGRVLDHMGRGTLKLDRVRVVVLDEADEMLDIGFAPDMERILRTTPRNRQTTLFSATMPPFILRMINKYLRAPAWVQITPEQPTVEEVDQCYYEIAERDKLEALAALLEEWGELPRALIFCKMQIGVDRLTRSLQRRGYHVMGIHGGMTQAERTRTMNGFRSGEIQALVATNVAARGLDIPDVTHVVSYDAPQNVEEYIHRIGRTARMGRKGTAIMFIAEWDFDVLAQIRATVGERVRQERSAIYNRVAAV